VTNFEVFRNGQPRKQGPTMTIACRRLLLLNHAADDLLGKPRKVQLLYDREARLIGVRAAAPDAENAYVVSGNYSRSISASAFLRHYAIPTAKDVARRWPATLRGDVLVIDLNETPTEVTSNRAKSRDSVSRYA
jgi:hypothetical protein